MFDLRHRIYGAATALSSHEIGSIISNAVKHVNSSIRVSEQAYY